MPDAVDVAVTGMAAYNKNTPSVPTIYNPSSLSTAVSPICLPTASVCDCCNRPTSNVFKTVVLFFHLEYPDPVFVEKRFKRRWAAWWLDFFLSFSSLEEPLAVDCTIHSCAAGSVVEPLVQRQSESASSVSECDTEAKHSKPIFSASLGPTLVHPWGFWIKSWY